jgi:pyruvate kinase
MITPPLEFLKHRRTKIVATVGPSCRAPVMIESLIAAGVNVFRLNMSHGERPEHEAAFTDIRAAARRVGEPVAVLADLCGPKIRVGHLAGGAIDLKGGQRLTVTTRDVVGGPGLIPSQYHGLAHDVKPGDRILLDDGLLELRVEAVAGTEIAGTVIHGGMLKERKGMNLPGVAVSAPALTDKDRDDARFALELGVDFLALSFVRRPADVSALKTLIADAGQATQVIAKIEKPQALEVIDEILEVSDGIMVARGDLGVELPPEAVPIAQQHLVRRARALNKPVIVATQMLESMVTHSRPTRAEVSDVSTAVFSGADAVMLSAETAAGAYPREAVGMMDRVARQVEAYQWSTKAFRSQRPPETPLPLPPHVAFARATAQLARELRVRTIIVGTQTGATSRIVSAARPSAPVLGVTSDPATWRRMNLLWGVLPALVDAADTQNPPALARRLALERELAADGQTLLMVTGFRDPPAVSEPAMTVLTV